MKILHLPTGDWVDALIENTETSDLKSLKKDKFEFDWRLEEPTLVYKLRLVNDKEILGLMSLDHFESEKRMEIRLLEVSILNRGEDRRYDGIAGNLIAFACKECVKYHGFWACVSLIPKTRLRQHYITKYGMFDDGGKHLYLVDRNLFKLIEQYNL
ncbi:MAG: N-acetyltransferase [Saprospiraceae bacterium]|nr:N-acetyltransferase [Saprospiraceae bacterium]